MSNPSFSNIDLWLFELAEGNLSPSQVEQLELFLLQHPELDVDRDIWEMASVNPTTSVFPEQDRLRKKRPIGWYSFASLGAIVVVFISWYLFSIATGDSKQQLANRVFDGSKTRVFVKQNNAGASILDPSNFSLANEIADLNESASSELQKAYKSDEDSNDSQQSPSLLLTAHANFDEVSEMSGEVDNSLKLDHLKIPLHSSTNEPSNDAVALRMVEKLDLLSAELLNVRCDDDLILAFREVEIINVDSEDELINNGSSEISEAFGVSSSEYKQTLKSRVNNVSRKLRRMMDNPVALKNFRDPYYHVPGMLPNDLNFSSTGTMLSTRVQTLSRLQWYGKENEQLHNQLAIDGYVYGMRGGIGLQVNHTMYNDGGMNVASAAITYSPKLSITKSISLEPSLRFKMGNKSLTKSKMGNVSQVEVERGNSHEFYPNGSVIGKQLWYRDLGVGLIVNTEWFFAGVQMDNLFRHKDNIYAQNFDEPRRADYHFVGTLGTDWVSRKENLSLSPYFVYQKSEKLSEAWLGANFRWNWFTIGGAISSHMEPAGSIGLKFDHFALSYNADYVKSAMTGQRSLSHQLTLKFVSKPSRFGKRLLNL